MEVNGVINWLLVNSPFLVAMVILICLSVRGFKNGFVKELCEFISAIIGSVAILLLAVAIHGAFDQERIQFVVAIVLMILLGIVCKLLGLFFTTLKFIAKVPVVSALNKVAGIFMAILETVVVVWAVYCVVILVGGGSFGTLILNCVRENPLMKFLYEYNFLYKLVSIVSGKLAAIDIWGLLGM